MSAPSGLRALLRPERVPGLARCASGCARAFGTASRWRLSSLLCPLIVSLTFFLASLTFFAICAPLRPRVAFAVDGLRGDLVAHSASGQLVWADGGEGNARVVRATFGSSGGGTGGVVEIAGSADGLQQPHSVAVDEALEKVYWTDSVSGKIQRAHINGSLVEDVVTGLLSPVGIAVAAAPAGSVWVFWANRGEGVVQRALVTSGDLLFEPFAQTIATPGTDDVHSVAVDAEGGKVYWSLSNSGRIQRSNLDGTDFEELVSSGLERPEALAVDATDGRIYWVDAGLGRVQRTSPGDSIETMFLSTTTPRGLALDVAARELYWGDRSGNILRASMDHGECVIVALTLGKEMAMFLLLMLVAILGFLCSCFFAAALALKLKRHRNKSKDEYFQKKKAEDLRKKAEEAALRPSFPAALLRRISGRSAGSTNTALRPTFPAALLRRISGGSPAKREDNGGFVAVTPADAKKRLQTIDDAPVASSAFVRTAGDGTGDIVEPPAGHAALDAAESNLPDGDSMPLLSGEETDKAHADSAPPAKIFCDRDDSLPIPPAEGAGKSGDESAGSDYFVPPGGGAVARQASRRASGGGDGAPLVSSFAELGVERDASGHVELVTESPCAVYVGRAPNSMAPGTTCCACWPGAG